MIKRLFVAGTVTAGLLLTLAGGQSAFAVPLAKPEIQKADGATLVRGRGHGRGHIGRGHRRHMGRSFGRHRFGRPHFRRFHRRFRPHIGRRHHRRFRFYPRYYGYAPFYYYDYYYRGNACAWLRRRALRTGRRYWWRRYHRCVRRYYY